MPLSFSHDNVGPLARTARDCARVLTVIAGHDPRDPTSAREPVPDYEAAHDGDLRGLRIGVPTNVFLDGADAPVVAAMEAALRGAGRRAAPVVSRFDLPLMDAVAAYGGIVSRVEAAPIHAEWMRSDPQAYGAHISGRMYPGYAIPAPYYVEALSRRGPVLRAFAAEVFAKVDVLVTPTIRTCLPTLAETDIDHGPPGTENEIHGGVGEYAAVQLSRAAGDQRAVRLRSERLPDRPADRRPPVRRRPDPEGRRRLSARHRLALGAAAGPREATAA